MPNITYPYEVIALISLILILALFIIYTMVKNSFAVKFTQSIDKTASLENELARLTEESQLKIHNLQATIDTLNSTNFDKSQQIIQLQTQQTNLEKRVVEYREDLQKLNAKLYDAGLANNDLQISLTKANAENENLLRRLEDERKQVDDLNKKFKVEFENLAQKILDEKSEKFAKQNQDNLNNILTPLQEKILGFEKKVESTHRESIEHGARLRQQIIGLKELNEQMSKEANNLTRALKGESKTQGNWGEMILESVLEKSGLQKDSEYFVQQSFQDVNGKRLLPDVIIHLPGNKKIIVDSKVSLTAYEKYINATDSEDKTQWQKLHLQSIVRHVEQLSQKNYHEIYTMDSLDFVLLFIPIESAFALASQSSPTLYRDAFERNIILVTPTTLLAVLKTIDTLWQNEKQKKNAIDIANQAGKLYDTFANLLTELLKVGAQMDTARSSYDSAMKKLTGNRNLFKNIENLKHLGAKASKQIDETILKNVEIDNEEEV